MPGTEFHHCGLAALEAIRKQHNLEETIGRLVGLMKSLPEGETRESFRRKSAAWIR